MPFDSRSPKVFEVLWLLYRLRKQLIVGNYCAFFSFYEGLDKLSKSLIDLYFGKVMIKFLLMICKTGGERVHINTLK